MPRAAVVYSALGSIRTFSGPDIANDNERDGCRWAALIAHFRVHGMDSAAAAVWSAKADGWDFDEFAKELLARLRGSED